MNTFQFIPLVQLIDENVTVLPSLVNNKIAIVRNNIYQLIPFGKYAVMHGQSVNPEDYAVLKTDRYTCIVNCKPAWIEKYKVYKLYTDVMGKTMNSKYLFKGIIL